MVKRYNQPAEENYQQNIEYSGGLELYIGYAAPGVLTSEAKWQIQKLFYDSDELMTELRYASGNDKFDKIWTDRADYDYIIT